MWLFKSSVGRKLVMSISGIFLILFLLFHLSMNVAAVFSGEAYNAICEFLGANWYAVAASFVLAGGFLVHIAYGIWLTVQNLRARGKNRYAVTATPKGVEWSSQNMLVLGIVVLLFIVMHLGQFWHKMMFAELVGCEPVLGGAPVSPTDGAAFIQYYFSNIGIVITYLVWYAALWFHLTHGFWSAIQTIGWNNRIWMNRWKCISNIFATVICLGFAAVTLIFYFRSLCCSSGCC